MSKENRMLIVQGVNNDDLRWSEFAFSNHAFGFAP